MKKIEHCNALSTRIIYFQWNSHQLFLASPSSLSTQYAYSHLTVSREIEIEMTRGDSRAGARKKHEKTKKFHATENTHLLVVSDLNFNFDLRIFSCIFHVRVMTPSLSFPPRIFFSPSSSAFYVKHNDKTTCCMQRRVR